MPRRSQASSTPASRNERPITAQTSMSVSVPGDVARAFLSEFQDEGSKKQFRAKLQQEAAAEWLPADGILEEANVAATSYAQTAKKTIGGLGCVRVDEIAIKYTYDTSMLEVACKSKPETMMAWMY